ncbi:MAG: phosphoribosyltransferase family protein [bacterium]|nr:phosphoribosyltransferase family protein [bacterium]
MQYLTLTWKRMQSDIYKLSTKIKEHNERFDLIVAIARGGLSISHIMSDFLKLPITTFTVSTYKDFKQEKIPEITLKIGNNLHKKRILLVDDVSDTGKTFIRGIDYLKELGVEHIKTASPFIKGWTAHIPDYYISKTDKWIIFPFDMKESVVDLCKIFKKEGLTIAESKKKLKELKIPKMYIEHYVT